MKNTIAIRYPWIKLLALLYTIIPIGLFFLGWLRWYYAIPGIALLITGLHYANKSPHALPEQSATLQLSLRTLLLIAFVLLTWSFLAGQGGFFYQSEDHHWRNAIFRDLITQPWPVKYASTHSALVYYFGHWLVPALIGKVFAIFLGNHIGWHVGNAALFLWTSMGLFLVALLLLFTVKAKTSKAVLIALSCLVFFSGLDIVGTLAKGGGIPIHLEWWASQYQFSSNTTLLFWVYNQTVVPWLATLLLLNEVSPINLAFIGLSVLPFGPLPFVGLFFLMVPFALKYCVEQIPHIPPLELAKQLFSIQNVTAIITIFPVFALFYSGNAASSSQGFRLDWPVVSTPSQVLALLTFCLLEFGIFALLLFKRQRQNLYYLTAVLSLLFIPLFKIGGGGDFAMRASIPALFVLMVFVIQYFTHQPTNTIPNKFPITAILLILSLAIGSITPIVEYHRAFSTVISTKRINCTADRIGSMNNKPLAEFSNFLMGSYEQSLFFSKLSK